MNTNDLRAIAQYVDQNHPNKYISIVEGYEDTYVILEDRPNEKEGRIVLSLTTILSN